MLIKGGKLAVPALVAVFPGPLVLDRYGYTAEQMPPANDHGPLLDVVVELADVVGPQLITHLGSVSNEVRFYATLIYGKVRYERALEHIYDRLFDKDQQIRQIARAVLKGYRGTGAFHQAVDRLHMDLCSDDDFRVARACQAAATLHDVTAVPVLVECLGASSRRVTTAAQQTLSQLSFEAFGSDGRRWMAWYEANRGGDRNAWLVNGLNHANLEIRQMAGDELRHIPGLLVNYMASAPEAQRRRAQALVAKFLHVS